MTPVVYDIPVHLVGAYSQRPIIVRSAEPEALVQALPPETIPDVVGVRLLSLAVEVECLADWAYAIPIELTISNPEEDFALLYRHAKLLDKHPLRVSIPVVRGCSKAIKLAVSLQFAVKLRFEAPDETAWEEAKAMLDFYLHHTSVTQPIEFFHSLLLTQYHRVPATIWDIQEEDPAQLRYVTDEGVEALARPRLGTYECHEHLHEFLANFKRALRSENGECSGCEFFESCGGYFKWQQESFSCVGVVPLLETLREAAQELRKDLAVVGSPALEVH